MIAFLVRSDRSRSGFLVLAIVCVNYLMKNKQFSEYWEYIVTLTFKIKIVITVKKCILFLSDFLEYM